MGCGEEEEEVGKRKRRDPLEIWGGSWRRRKQ